MQNGTLKRMIIADVLMSLNTWQSVPHLATAPIVSPPARRRKAATAAFLILYVSYTHHINGKQRGHRQNIRTNA
jgi:hypothetical protein